MPDNITNPLDEQTGGELLEAGVLGAGFAVGLWPVEAALFGTAKNIAKGIWKGGKAASHVPGIVWRGGVAASEWGGRNLPTVSKMAKATVRTGLGGVAGGGAAATMGATEGIARAGWATTKLGVQGVSATARGVWTLGADYPKTTIAAAGLAGLGMAMVPNHLHSQNGPRVPTSHVSDIMQDMNASGSLVLGSWNNR
jgi:hypothetical protein